MDFLHLEVRLTIKVLCFNIENTFILGRAQDHNVCRKEFVLIDAHNVSNLDIFPHPSLKTSVRPRINVRKGMVLVTIRFVSLIVLIGIFYHRKHNDKDKGRRHGRLAI